MENKPLVESGGASASSACANAPTSSSPAPEKPLKLNTKRTVFIGLAFFGILLLWGIYNSYCGNFLTYLFAEQMFGLPSAELNKAINADKLLQVQWLVGIIMALDNIAALFLMPIFGNLSDKKKSKFGRRMPFIIVGTIVSAIALPFIPVFFNMGIQNNNDVMAITGVICTMVIVLCFMMMYRSPAVALMPDMTPKPLRSRANGIINIIGYFGGAVAVVFGIFLPFSAYVSKGEAHPEAYHNFWWIEIPFIVASVILLISLGVLLWKVKENKVAAEMKDEMARGDKMSETVDLANDDAPMSKQNKRNLLLILAAEVLWFMSFNAIETFLGNYVMFYLDCSSSAKSFVDLLNGAVAAITFMVAGLIAEKIGRKKTILLGLGVVTIAYLLFCFVPTGVTGDLTFAGKSVPWVLYVVFGLAGIGSSLIHNNSFPMVVDFCNSKKIGKFTSYYYAASMIAQSVTPVAVGAIFFQTGQWRALPIYSCILMGAAFVIFFFVKAPVKAKGVSKKGLEALDVA